MFEPELTSAASNLLVSCKSKGIRLSTAESCTGGLISALITEIAGSSAVFERGFVTYSNESKIQMLGVDASLISEQGAVSEAVALAMAQGARIHAKVDLAVAVTGIAGPGGGSKEKPVGTVCIATACETGVMVERFHFIGDRGSIRMQTAAAAIQMLKNSLENSFTYVA